MNLQFFLGLASVLLMAYLAWHYKVTPFAMMALAADRDTGSMQTKIRYNYPLYQATTIYAGALVGLNATGYLVEMSEATGLICVGRASANVDNSDGDSGDLTCDVEEGVFGWDNSDGADEITIASIGDTCYAVDGGTVAKTNGGGTRSACGIVKQVDDDYVWVDTPGAQVVTAGLTAANNLSDVSTAATARANIGANKIILTLEATDLKGADAVVYGVVCPVAGTITRIDSVLKGHALATGNATLTGKINGTAITTGLITITQAGSAIGDKDTCSPSALNVVAAGDEIQFLVGGTNDNAAAFAQIAILIET